MSIDLNALFQPVFWSVDQIDEVMSVLDKFSTPGNPRRTRIVKNVQDELTQIRNIKASRL